MVKYVIFKRGMILIPLLFSDQIAHCEVNVEDAKPVSAGFFNLKTYEVSKKGSDSLGLEPHKNDSKYFLAAIRNDTSSFFLDMDDEY